MSWFRSRTPSRPHRGRVWLDTEIGFWRYACHDCDYGAGTRAGNGSGHLIVPLLVKQATEHGKCKVLT